MTTKIGAPADLLMVEDLQGGVTGLRAEPLLWLDCREACCRLLLKLRERSYQRPPEYRPGLGHI